MASNRKGSFLPMLVISALAAAFVAFISWGSFTDPARILIAAAIAFVVVFLVLVVLRLIQKEDDVKPGVPRLK